MTDKVWCCAHCVNYTANEDKIRTPTGFLTVPEGESWGECEVADITGWLGPIAEYYPAEALRSTDPCPAFKAKEGSQPYSREWYEKRYPAEEFFSCE